MKTALLSNPLEKNADFYGHLALLMRELCVKKDVMPSHLLGDDILMMRFYLKGLILKRAHGIDKTILKNDIKKPVTQLIASRRHYL